MGKENFKLGLKNFKTFQSLETFEIAPITLLVGPNNSGKTSFLEALKLLQSNFSRKRNPLPYLETIANDSRGSFKSFLNKSSDSEKLFFSFENKDFTSNKRGFFDHQFYNYFENEEQSVDFDLQSFENHFEFKKDGIHGLLNSYKVFINSEKRNLLTITANNDDEGTYNIDLDLTYFISSVEDLQDLFSFEDFLDEEIGFNKKNDKKNKIQRYTFKFLQELNKLKATKNDLKKIYDGDFLSGLTSFKKPRTMKEEENENLLDEEEKYSKLYARKITKHFIESFLGYFFGHMDGDFLVELKDLTEPMDRINWINDSPEWNISLDGQTVAFFEKWLKKFGIGESIIVKDLEEEELQLMYVKQNNLPIKLTDLGEGAQKIVSLLFNLSSYLYHDKPTLHKTFLLCEPEKSLHPKLQSLLADFIVELKNNFGVNFVIETHSEYLIRKLQLLVVKQQIAASNCIINYFNASHDNYEGKKRVYPIAYLEDGRLDKAFGPGFYDETTELMREHFKTLKNN